MEVGDEVIWLKCGHHSLTDSHRARVLELMPRGFVRIQLEKPTGEVIVKPVRAVSLHPVSVLKDLKVPPRKGARNPKAKRNQ